MAEMQMVESRGSCRGRKRASLRVDLTPMVDLGFLLIAFFMYTTTLAKPAVLELAVPPRPSEPVDVSTVPASSTIVIMPTAHHRIAWYRGFEDPAHDLHFCSATGAQGLRVILERETSRVASLPAAKSKSAHQLHVLVKPDDRAAYDDLVRVLDEMQIGAVPNYTIMRPDAAELSALRVHTDARE